MMRFQQRAAAERMLLLKPAAFYSFALRTGMYGRLKDSTVRAMEIVQNSRKESCRAIHSPFS
jgi:hypothetical protein